MRMPLARFNVHWLVRTYLSRQESHFLHAQSSLYNSGALMITWCLTVIPNASKYYVRTVRTYIQLDTERTILEPYSDKKPWLVAMYVGWLNVSVFTLLCLYLCFSNPSMQTNGQLNATSGLGSRSRTDRRTFSLSPRPSRWLQP